MDYYKGKKVFITGGSSGIGKAAALLIASWGAHVCIGARDSIKLAKAIEELRAHAKSSDQKIFSVSIDVSDRKQTFTTAENVVQKLDGIDVLINSAGITCPGYISELPDAVWDSMMGVDYFGTVNMVRAFLPYFKRQKHGHIANVSSVVGYMGVFGYAAYAPAKFAVVGFSECLRQELIPYNIGVSVIYPPDTDTPQWHEENKIKPQETRVLSGNIKVMAPEKVAYSLLKGISRSVFSIVPGVMNKVTYFMNRHVPGIVWMIVSGDLRKYWKKQSGRASR